MKINSNINAHIAANALSKNQRVMGNAMERLSTGVRINSARDDAAGLAITSKMTSQINGLKQAVRNTNDAISMLQVAEGATVEITNMLQRMRELAVQAANGANTANDREALDKEFQHLSAEIDRISKNTQWNGKNLLDGTGFTNGTANFQIGANADQTIEVNLGDIHGLISGTSKTLGSMVAVGNELQVATISQDNGWVHYPSVSSLSDGGFVITWTKMSLPSTEKNIFGQRYDAQGALVGDEFQINSITTQSTLHKNHSHSSIALLNDGAFVANWWSTHQGSYSPPGVFGQLYNAEGTAVGTQFQISIDDGYHKWLPGHKISSIAPLSDGGFVVVWDVLKSGVDGHFHILGQRFDTSGQKVGDEFKIGHENNPRTTPKVISLAKGGFVVAWQETGNFSQGLGFGYGYFGQRYDSNGLTIGTEIPLYVDYGNLGEYSIAAKADGGFVFAHSIDGLQYYDATGTAVGDKLSFDNRHGPLFVSPASDGDLIVSRTSTHELPQEVFQRFDSLGTAMINKLEISSHEKPLMSLTHAGLPEGGFVAVKNLIPLHAGGEYTITGQRYALQMGGIRTEDTATKFLEVIDNGISFINDLRSSYGAAMNRLEYAADNLTNIAQNTEAARSRILDTDYASETTELARTQIIQQAATAMLIQANQQAKYVLELLKSV